ncbi:hypothetical protein C0W52_17225 [Photobacterium kishitanii]|uniref:Uncharacterized protein n=1 Tax=Photobacterium kishitanii TaxID=318456 RepID=A0AAX0YSP8_9GAMM|nr:hypothetical protein C0W52_17225 [Photobacterium kishitanii]PSX39040.1 hypothetical protein C0W53_21870 [Photobacterium kishitanii]
MYLRFYLDLIFHFVINNSEQQSEVNNRVIPNQVNINIQRKMNNLLFILFMAKGKNLFYI